MNQSDNEFERAAKRRQPGIVSEFIVFLRYNKKWWLAPIVLILLLISGLVLVLGSPAGPFIYALF